MDDVRVRRVSTPRDLRRFVDVPWQIFAGSQFSQWVPPLRHSVKRLLDPSLNPFFRHADMALFLAERRGRPVGRIAAIDNRWFARSGGEPQGFFGFFDAEEDPSSSAALFKAAEEWLAERGHREVQGPISPSTNYEVGLLVDGFEHIPTFMTTWNPPYYLDLLEHAGYTGVKSLLAWHLRIAEIQEELHRRFKALSERAKKRDNLSFGPLNLARFEDTMARCWEVYTHAWRSNWGYCPLEFDEFLFIANELKPLLVQEGTLGVEVDGRLIAFVFFVPDFNRALLRNRSGRLLPFGWLRLLRAKKHTPWVRTMLAGIVDEYRKLGVLPLLLYEAVRKAPEFGVQDVEMSWVLEDNEDVNRTARRLGATAYRTWRVYEREITAPSNLYS